jgi:hypothetical protein
VRLAFAVLTDVFDAAELAAEMDDVFADRGLRGLGSWWTVLVFRTSAPTEGTQVRRPALCIAHASRRHRGTETTTRVTA